MAASRRHFLVSSAALGAAACLPGCGSTPAQPGLEAGPKTLPQVPDLAKVVPPAHSIHEICRHFRRDLALHLGPRPEFDALRVVVGEATNPVPLSMSGGLAQNYTPLLEWALNQMGDIEVIRELEWASYNASLPAGSPPMMASVRLRTAVQEHHPSIAEKESAISASGFGRVLDLSVLTSETGRWGALTLVTNGVDMLGRSGLFMSSSARALYFRLGAETGSYSGSVLALAGGTSKTVRRASSEFEIVQLLTLHNVIVVLSRTVGMPLGSWATQYDLPIETAPLQRVLARVRTEFRHPDTRDRTALQLNAMRYAASGVLPANGLEINAPTAFKPANGAWVPKSGGGSAVSIKVHPMVERMQQQQLFSEPFEHEFVVLHSAQASLPMQQRLVARRWQREWLARLAKQDQAKAAANAPQAAPAPNAKSACAKGERCAPAK